MLIKSSKLVFPFSSVELFPENPTGKLHLEVGFGDGRFWNDHHLVENGVNYLGVELSGVSILKTIARLKKSGLKTVRLIKSKAEFVVNNIKNRSLTRVYVNFPDPWPKKRHEESRLLRKSFFDCLSTRLEMNGELWLTTDHPEYFEFACQEAEKSGFYTILKEDPPIAALKTKYASRWQDLGFKIFHARFKLTGNNTQLFSHLEIFDMPHAVLTGKIDHISLDKSFHQDESNIVFLKNYRSDDQIIVLTKIEEADFDQEVLLSITQKPDNEILIGVESFGGPLITKGIKKAIEILTEKLKSQGFSLKKASF